MGYGDELMVTGRARVMQQRDPRKCLVTYQGIEKWTRYSRVFDNNPRIAKRGETGDFQELKARDANGLRPYHTAKTDQRWGYNRHFRPDAGELYFSLAEKTFAAPYRPQVVIEPTIKAGASPNKQWGLERWQEFARLMRKAGYALTQFGPPGTRPLQGAELIETPDFRSACAVLANARAYVGHEGGLHHAAAALGIPGVVIFGGFTPVELTGYPMHLNLGVGIDAACGMRTPCAHCAKEMAAIEPDMVLAELRALLARGEGRGKNVKNCGGVWLPDGEQHLVEWMKNRNEVIDGKLTYQYHKFQAAMLHVKQFRTAVDVGAHCGLWSMHLAKRFETVHAFEPVADHRECFLANVTGVNAVLHAAALGEREGMVSMNSAATSSGDTTVSEGDDVPLKMLDSYNLRDVDFIKLDCEGYELFALKGGTETIKRCKPCVIVEQKPGKAQQFGLPETGAVDWLRAMGAVLRKEISGDYILSW